MRKPKIFISSTIYDFKDLRSALKYWLEKMGFNVQLSEFNDFEKKLDESSYDACLKNIESCDYFILFIGTRIGGFYNYENQISITQKEYRYAYDLAKNMDIQIITFVRQEIWNIRNDRKSLEKLLRKEYNLKKELSKEDVDKIANHKSDFVNDAKFIFDFLNEVGRKEEMIKAIYENEEFPKQNWIHQFNIFNDIIDVLIQELNVKNDFEYNIHKANIKREIGNNLSVFLTKNNNEINTYISWASFARNQLSKSFSGKSKIKGQYLIWLSIFEYIGTGLAHNTSTKFIYNALSSGVFYKYDKNKKSFVPRKLHNSLLKLTQEIESLKQIEQQYNNSKFNLSLTKNHNKPDPEKDYEIDNSELIMLMLIHDRQYNIIRLSQYILALLNGKNISSPKLLPRTPFREENENIKEEEVSVKEAIDVVENEKLNL